VVEPSQRATALASSFAATLELVREGVIELHQHAAFAPLYLRKRAAEAQTPSGDAPPIATNEG
jgi:segregation and condensation protein A